MHRFAFESVPPAFVQQVKEKVPKKDLRPEI